VIQTLLANGDGTFAAPQSFALGVSGVNSLNIADIDGDGRNDLLAMDNSTNRPFIYLGNGDGTLSAPVSLPAFAVSTLSGVLHDVNSDGATDIVIFGNGLGGVMLQNTTTAGTGTPLPNLEGVDLSTSTTALTSLDLAKGTLEGLNRISGTIGSIMGRLEVAVANLATRRESYLAAASRITDADIASEFAVAIRASILQQSAASVLAQANQAPEVALSLLRNI
jgi:flagellin-like hook-associated protein FlgL